MPLLLGPFPFEDETGADGVCVLPEHGRKKVKFGTRLAVTREKRSEHANKRSLEEAAQEAEQGLKIEAQDKALGLG